MSILDKVGEAQVLRAEDDRMLSKVLIDCVAAVARPAGRLLRKAWYLTTLETSHQLQPIPIRRHAGR